MRTRSCRSWSWFLTCGAALATATLATLTTTLTTASAADSDAAPGPAPSDKAAPGIWMSMSNDMDARLDPTAKADQAYIDSALTMTMVTIASARMALSQSGFPANVRHAAQTLLDDDAALDTRLRALALQQGFVVPGTLTDHDRRKIDRLASCHDLRFLDAWVTLQVAEHDTAISLFAGRGQALGRPRARRGRLAPAAHPGVRPRHARPPALWRRSGRLVALLAAR